MDEKERNDWRWVEKQMVYRLTRTLLLTFTVVLTPLQDYYYLIIVICLIVVNKNLISELNALGPRILKQKPSINLRTITVMLSW